MIVQRSDYNISIVLFTNLGVGAGTENIAKILAEQLLKNDTSHRVRIVQTDYMGPYSANKRVDIQNENGLIIDEIKSPLNIKFIQRMLKGPPLWHKIGEIVKIVLYMILNFKKISSILKEDDCIIFLSYNEAWGWYPFKRQNNYFVISGDCGMPTVGLAKCILEKFADSLHFLTRAQEERFGSTQKLTFTIPNGVYTDSFTSIREKEIAKDKKLRVLFVGRVDETKGIKEIVEAAKYFENENWLEIRIVGTGELSGFLSKIESKVLSYSGYVEREDLTRIYASSDIFLFPSYGESYGTVVLEAVSSGLYALVSEELKGNFDDLEFLGALKYFKLSPDNLVHELIAMKSYKADENKRRFIHSYMVKHYDWDRIAHTWKNCLGTLIYNTDRGSN